MEGAEVAPSMLSDPSKRPPTLRDPLPDDAVNHVPRTPLALDEDKFGKNQRSAKRGAAAGPSGMTIEHIRPLLENARILHPFFQMCERLAQAKVPQAVVEAVQVGRMTALRKPDGGVEGIIVGDVIRRLIGKAVLGASALPMFCKACAANGDLYRGERFRPNIARCHVGCIERGGRRRCSSVVRMFCGASSSYLWEDTGGVVHTISQGEGGEQRDALMPLQFAVGQHTALEAIQEDLQEGEVLLAYHDDIHTVSPVPERVHPPRPSALPCQDSDPQKEDTGLEPWRDETVRLRCA